MESFMDIHGGCEDVRVNLGHAVNGVGAHDAQVGHVDPLLSAFLDQGHTTETVVVARVTSSNSLNKKR